MKAPQPKLNPIKLSLAAVVLLSLTACGSSDDSTTAQKGAESSPSASSTHDVHSPGAGNTVEMRLIQFRPEQLEVEVGQEVTWSQKDAGFHTVTSGTVEQTGGGVTGKPDDKFRSERLAIDERFKFTFDEAGTFAYFCEIHPATMRGEVIVGA